MLLPEIRVWSVFDRDDRLVLALSNEPGEYNFARLPPPGTEPVFCRFATIQCYQSKCESQILELLFRCADLMEYLERLERAGFKVQEGRPRAMRFARL